MNHSAERLPAGYRKLFLEYYRKLKEKHDKNPNDMELHEEYLKANEALSILAFGC